MTGIRFVKTVDGVDIEISPFEVFVHDGGVYWHHDGVQEMICPEDALS